MKRMGVRERDSEHTFQGERSQRDGTSEEKNTKGGLGNGHYFEFGR